MTNAVKTNEPAVEGIALDENTQSRMKSLVDAANVQIKQINHQLQERLGLVVEAVVNTKGETGKYVINKDFTALELLKEE